jgi:hypothetical protein
MMSLKFNSPFLGIPVIAPLNDRNRPNSLYSGRGQLSKRGFRKCICVKKHSDWVAQAIRFSLFCGKDVELVRNAHGLGVECVKESFVQSKALCGKVWNPKGVLTFENGDVAAQVSNYPLVVKYFSCSSCALFSLVCSWFLHTIILTLIFPISGEA